MPQSYQNMPPLDVRCRASTCSAICKLVAANDYYVNHHVHTSVPVVHILLVWAHSRRAKCLNVRSGWPGQARDAYQMQMFTRDVHIL